MNRREFLGGAFAAVLSSRVAFATESKRPRILLRSSWQTVNIGDIAHTPGMLALLEKHLPQAEVRLWPKGIDRGVEEMLQRRFPMVAIVRGDAALKAAFQECDLLLHGSGPSLVAQADLVRWSQETGKPYGAGGVTLAGIADEASRTLLDGASFLFFRDTRSLKLVRDQGCKCPLMEFGPDATFSLDLRDDPKADSFLRQHSLETGKFACFVPRLRYTPYWGPNFDPKGPGVTKERAQQVAERVAINEKHQEADHAKLRAAIVAWVRETGTPAMLCPEMTYEVELLRPLLFDALPQDVQRKVVIRPTYWLTDEAASTYARASAVVSLEMHSPIIAVANGTPAIHVREPTDTHKGQMWADVGLGDWLFYEIDATTGEEIAARLLALHRDPEKTKATVAKAREFTTARGKAMMEAVAKAIT